MLQRARVQGIRKYRHYSTAPFRDEWPPAVPITVPHSSARSVFHENYGRYVNNAALYNALDSSWLRENSAAASGVLNMYLSEHTARTLALALPLHRSAEPSDTAEAYYRLVGHIAEARGLEEAVEWVKALYAPFLANARNLKPARPTPAQALAESQPLSDDKAFQIKKPMPEKSQVSSDQSRENKPLGPIDLSSSDGMNLFDPESWLTESPTGQRLWKESE